jgi:hypothetical protein
MLKIISIISFLVTVEGFLQYHIGNHNITFVTNETHYQRYDVTIMFHHIPYDNVLDLKVSSFSPFSYSIKNIYNRRVVIDYPYQSINLFDGNRLYTNRFMMSSKKRTEMCSLFSPSPVILKIASYNPIGIYLYHLPKHLQIQVTPNYFNTTLIELY